MQHHVRRFVPIPKCGRIRALCSVMNPRPQLALPFAHRRRLLLLFRLLYHLSCRTAKPVQTAPVSHTAHAQCHPGPTSDGTIVADLSASSPSRLRTVPYSSTNSRYRHCRPRELPYHTRGCPSSCSLVTSPPTHIPFRQPHPYSCATSPAPATCQPCALTQHEARGSHSHWCNGGLRAICTALRLVLVSLLRNPSMIDSIRLVARDTSLIGSLAISSRDLRLYSSSCRCRFAWSLIIVAAHVRSRDNVAYSADLEQMWVEIPSERGLPLQVMLADLSDALFCLLCIWRFCHATQCNAVQRVLRWTRERGSVQECTIPAHG